MYRKIHKSAVTQIPMNVTMKFKVNFKWVGPADFLSEQQNLKAKAEFDRTKVRFSMKMLLQLTPSKTNLSSFKVYTVGRNHKKVSLRDKRKKKLA